MRIIFDTFEAYNEAKQLPLETISIGEPVYETADGLLTGRFIVDHQFTAEQVEELAGHGIGVEREEINKELIKE